jgi:ADP-ribosyl-[dinitrogen reductase] hydrolase
MRTYDIQNIYQGIIIGTAVGDSLGLPAEGLSTSRIERNGWRAWRHRFIFGKGMISDDTEHTIFVAQALLEHPEDSVRFQKLLATKLRWWLLSLPAGTGMATAKSILKLWCGCSPRKSGVYSAGNGPAMRAAIIGAFFSDNELLLLEYVKASTELTHTDPKAMTGALAIAKLSAEIALNGIPNNEKAIDLLLKIQAQDQEWLGLIEHMKNGLEKSSELKDFCRAVNMSRGISGYMYQTVPAVIYSILRNKGQFKESLEDVLNCGGDADTTGAILGAVLGASGKSVSIPAEWVENIVEWPRSVSFMRVLSEQLDNYKNGKNYAPVNYFLPFVLVRNILFLLLVLLHGLLRLIPAFLIRKICP